MSNDSSTGGPLTPGSTSPAVLQDDALTDLLTSWVVGITSMDPTLVRPRWQVNPPNQPTVSQSWLAMGLEDVDPDWDAFERHAGSQPDGDGSDVVQRTEEFSLLCSFYGPLAQTNAALLRDGCSVRQNRELLWANGITLVGAGKSRPVPALINSQWYNRRDMTVTMRRYVVRVYPVKNITEVVGTVVNEVEFDDAPQTFPFNVPNN